MNHLTHHEIFGGVAFAYQFSTHIIWTFKRASCLFACLQLLAKLERLFWREHNANFPFIYCGSMPADRVAPGNAFAL